MLRVDTHEDTGALLVKIEGKLCGDYAEHARSLIRRCNGRMQTIVDLTDVTSIDSAGEEVLSFLGRLGARFVAENAYSRYLCERLQLPLVMPALHNGNNGKGNRK